MTPTTPRLFHGHAARELADARLIQAIAVAQCWASGDPIRIQRVYGFHVAWLGYPPCSSRSPSGVFAKCRRLAARGHAVIQQGKHDSFQRVYATDEGRVWAWRIGGCA